MGNVLKNRLDTIISASDTLTYLCNLGEYKYRVCDWKYYNKIMFYHPRGFLETCVAVDREPEYIKFENDATYDGELLFYYKDYKVTCYVLLDELAETKECFKNLFPKLRIEELKDED